MAASRDRIKLDHRLIVIGLAALSVIGGWLLYNGGHIKMGSWASGSHGAIELAIFLMAGAVIAAAIKSDIEQHHGLQFPEFWFVMRTLVILTALEIAISNGLLNNAPREYLYADQVFGTEPGEILSKCTELSSGVAGSVCNEPYRYSPGFLVSLVDPESGRSVPIFIGLGWAFVFYAARNTAIKLLPDPEPVGSSSLFTRVCHWSRNVPRALRRSALAALLVLSIDFALDPIADASSWWVWGERKGMSTFFDVPITNYAAWFVFVFTISFVYFQARAWVLDRGMEMKPAAEEPRPTRSEGIVIAILGIIPLLLGLLWKKSFWVGLRNTALLILPGLAAYAAIAWVKHIIYSMDVDRADDTAAFASVLLIFVTGAIFWASFPFQRDYKLGAAAAAVITFPLILHGLFLFVLLRSPDMLTEHRDLAITIPMSASIGFVVFAWPYLDALIDPKNDSFARQIQSGYKRLVQLNSAQGGSND